MGERDIFGQRKALFARVRGGLLTALGIYSSCPADRPPGVAHGSPPGCSKFPVLPGRLRSGRPTPSARRQAATTPHAPRHLPMLHPFSPRPSWPLRAAVVTHSPPPTGTLLQRECLRLRRLDSEPDPPELSQGPPEPILPGCREPSGPQEAGLLGTGVINSLRAFGPSTRMTFVVTISRNHGHQRRSAYRHTRSTAHRRRPTCR